MVNGWQQEGHGVLLQMQTTQIGHQQRMHKIWIDSGYRQVTEQRLADQANQTWKKGWFSQMNWKKLNDGHHLQPRVKTRILKMLPLSHTTKSKWINAHRRESDTISQEDVEDSNNEPTEEQKEICRKLKEYLQNGNARVRLTKLKAIPKKNIKEQIRIVEAVIVMMKRADITKTNALVYAGTRFVRERLNVKPNGSQMQKKPPQKIRLEKQLRANTSKLQEWQKGSLRKKKKTSLTECTRSIRKDWVLPQKK